MMSSEQENQQSVSPDNASAASAAHSASKIYEQIEALRQEVMEEEGVAGLDDRQDDESKAWEFLSALSYEELLDTAVELSVERDVLYRQTIQQPDPKKLEVLRDQFIHAIDEIKTLREQNAQLQRLQPTSPIAEVDRSGEADWETQKNNLLSRLAGDAEEAAPSPPSHDDQINKRLQYVIHGLKQENTKLRARLKQKSPRDEILDRDEVVQQELQRLQEVQEQWQEKVRSGELQLSKDRADIARKKLQLDERESRLQLLREQLERQQQKILEKPGGWRGVLG